MPRILPVDPARPAPAAVAEAARALAEGRLVVLPTETVYGLAADPARPAALDALRAAKGRDAAKPLAWLAADLAAVVAAGARPGPAARRLAARYWPGPLTLVLDAPGGARGFRVPDHAVAQAVLHAFGRPFAATSANRSGEPDARTAAEAVAALGDAVALVLDGGPARGGVPSSVVRETAEGVRVLREGAIAAAAIDAVAGGRGPVP